MTSRIENTQCARRIDGFQRGPNNILNAVSPSAEVIELVTVAQSGAGRVWAQDGPGVSLPLADPYKAGRPANSQARRLHCTLRFLI